MSGGTNMSRDLEKASQINNARLDNEIELLLLQQQRPQNGLIEREMDLDMCRSGSAPPTIKGAVNAVGSLFRGPNSSQLTNNGSGSVTNEVMSEEEIRAHPSYLAYYYSNENKNPRLPPPLMTREDWRVAQRMGSSFGGRGDWRNKNVADYGGSSSLFSTQPAQKADEELMLLRKAANNNSLRRSSPDLLEQSMHANQGADLGSRRKSFADIVQENQSLAGQLSRPSSRNSLTENLATSGVSDARSSELQGRASTSEVLHPGNSLTDVAASHAALSMSNNQFHRKENHLNSHIRPPQFRMGGPNTYLDRSRSEAANYGDLIKESGFVPPCINNSSSGFNGQPSRPRKAYSSTNLPTQVDPPGFASMEEWNSYNLPNNNNNQAAGLALQNAMINAQMKRNAGHAESDIHPALFDPQHIHQLLKTYNQHMNTGPEHSNQSQMLKNNHRNRDRHDMEMLYLENLLSHQNLQYQPPMYNSPGLHHRHHTDLGFDHMGRSLHPTVGNGPAMYQNNRIPLDASSMNKIGNAGSRNVKAETIREGPPSTLLDELKSNSRSLELSDVVGHITEFSKDQYGSRFIQEKLETATCEEKMKIFPEVMLCARSLMTDVFGNYVIQKFFEHGSESQRKELASQLMGHVLSLSLQMYGCRVIQKALEMVGVEQQTEMVQELDGSVMKCVRDQNGNHVIQKCIEFVPPDRIQFIISSFFGQVVTLSMHPYGCRVIQRVLENFNDPGRQNLIMDEIMESICILAQDQYGNYVIQHVLQHGKPHERSAIINKLAGQIVKMSQQKYASNVVERCLTFGSPEERQILVNEMLGSTDENEPLQAMMKDPFANYVVQKILETCDDQSHDLILSRIKVHLDSLKKYTYGKHIVSRVEKLVTAGEKSRNKES